MQKYIPLRIHTALYLSVFFLALHHVFVYFANSSILKYFFNLATSQVIFVYGVASVFSLLIFIYLSNRKKTTVKSSIYISTFVEILCLMGMYIGSTHTYMYLYIASFCIHHLITPYILYNLDALFEAYTHVQDRGKGRGIYLTMWNSPFIIVPLLLSALSVITLPIVYIISTTLLIPFIFFIYTYIQNPDFEHDQGQKTKSIEIKSFVSKIKSFWADKLDRNSFITQSTLHLYYGITGVLLPIYLHSYFGFEWDSIGMLLAITLVPFVLFQIYFGSMEDKKHNEKKLFIYGILLAISFTICALIIQPSMKYNFILLASTLFISRVGCALIEISTEGLFYKHVSERDSFALLMFRAGRIFPYALGLLALFWII